MTLYFVFLHCIVCICIIEILCACILYTLTQRERDRFRKLLSERDTHVEDHRGTGQGGLTSVADLQAKLADKKCQLQNLADECQKWKDKAEQAEAQVHTVWRVGLASIKFDEIALHCYWQSLSQCLSPWMCMH